MANVIQYHDSFFYNLRMGRGIPLCPSSCWRRSAWCAVYSTYGPSCPRSTHTNHSSSCYNPVIMNYTHLKLFLSSIACFGNAQMNNFKTVFIYNKLFKTNILKVLLMQYNVMSPTGPQQIWKGITLENQKLCFDTRMPPTATKSKRAMFSNLICIMSIEFIHIQISSQYLKRWQRKVRKTEF